MASSNTKPSYIPTPFASQGQKNTIPVADQGNYLASWSLGFPPVTSEPLSEGGLPPTRLDVNGALNVLSAFVYYLQVGGLFTFDPDLSSYIGGYPNGMMLWYNDGTNVYPLVSTKNNNTDNFISNPSYIGTSWVKTTPTVSDINLILETLYPVGSIYIGTQGNCPLETLIPGSTWVNIEGRYLLASGTLNGTSETYSATNTVPAGLPNITGSIGPVDRVYGEPSGAFYANGNILSSGWTSSNNSPEVCFSASLSSSVYGQSATARPAAYVVNVWRRTA